MSSARDRRSDGRPENARSRDITGRPLTRGVTSTAPEPAPQPQQPAQALGEVQSLIDQGRPFRAHEVCEAQWKAVPREDIPERAFWQGLAQLCVGLTHLSRGNVVGARTLLERGSARLRESGDRHGTDVAQVVAQAAVVAEQLTGTLSVVPLRRNDPC